MADASKPEEGRIEGSQRWHERCLHLFDYLPSVPGAEKRCDSTKCPGVISLISQRERGLVQNHSLAPGTTIGTRPPASRARPAQTGIWLNQQGRCVR